MYLLELFDIACVLFEQFFGSSLLGSQVSQNGSSQTRLGRFVD